MNKRLSFLLFLLQAYSTIVSSLSSSSSSSDSNDLQAKLAHVEGHDTKKNPLLLGVSRNRHDPSQSADAHIPGIRNKKKKQKNATAQEQNVATTTTGRTHNCPPSRAPSLPPSPMPTISANFNHGNGGPTSTKPPTFVGVAAPPPTNPPTASKQVQPDQVQPDEDQVQPDEDETTTSTQVPNPAPNGASQSPNVPANPRTPTFAPMMQGNPQSQKPSNTPVQTEPTAWPTNVPSNAPSFGPTAAPSDIPTQMSQPTMSPSSTPTATPTRSMSPTVSVAPSLVPSITFDPTVQPTALDVFAQQNDRKDVIAHKCNGMKVRKRTNMMIQIIEELSGSQSLSNVESPYYRAFNWINRLDGRIVCPTESSQFLQRYILALFYYSMLGDTPWTSCDPNESQSHCASEDQRWLGSGSECDWFGVTCNVDGVITHLDLQRNGLDGYLPVELFTLSAMQGLSLGHNEKIRGTIPLEIGQWEELTYLDLDYNDLEGDFPNVYSIKSLQAIDLNNNRFSGTINPAIGQLTQLVVFQIENNQFQGMLPLEVMGSSMEQLVLFSSQGNPWTDSHDWENLCDWVPDRRAVNSPAYLQFLLADCGPASPQSCSCCSVCF